MHPLPRLIRNFARNERGATAIEYALIVASIAVGVVVGMGEIGENVGALFIKVKNAWL